MNVYKIALGIGVIGRRFSETYKAPSASEAVTLALRDAGVSHGSLLAVQRWEGNDWKILPVDGCYGESDTAARAA